MPYGKYLSARSAVATASAVFTVACLTVLSHAQDAKPTTPPPGSAIQPAADRPVQTAAQRYKNIQVLKDLPADQLIPTMRAYAASLGVRCDACHVRGQGPNSFALDDKPEKRTARQMILMVRDINRREKVLDNKATCYMCHRGQEMPQTMVPPPAGGPEMAPRGSERRENESGERSEGAGRPADKD